MKGLRLRALVLTAGLGTRLRPLTEFLPKPLLPVAGRPLVAHTLSRLAAVGCGQAVLNLHYKGDEIRKALGGAFEGVSLEYSEEEELLGTMGAAVEVREFLADGDLALVVNGDSLCRWPFGKLIRAHLRGSAAITLLLARGADTEEFGGGVGVDKKGRVISTGPANRFGEVAHRRVYAGAQVLSPEIVTHLERRPADFVADLWVPHLERGEEIAALQTSEPWFDSGTPARYLAGVREWARGHGPLRALRSGRVAPGAEVASGARVRRSVVEAGVRVEAGAVVEESLLLPGARVGAGATVRRSILGPEVSLPAEAGVERRLVTVVRADVQSRPADSVVGGLVYSALDSSGG